MDLITLIAQYGGPHALLLLLTVLIFKEYKNTQDSCRNDMKEIINKYEAILTELNTTLAILTERISRE